MFESNSFSHVLKFTTMTTATWPRPNFILRGFLLTFILMLAACGSQQIKIAEKTEEGVRVPLVSTAEFIPVQKVDKDGLPVAYKVKENPYLAKRSRVKKESVDQFIQAKRYLKTNDERGARNVLSSIIENDKRVSGPHVLLGDLELQAGELENAISHYEQALAVNSRNVNAYLKLAEARRQHGDYGIAQNVYAKALAVWPDFPEAHLNLGVLYDVYLNQPEKAQRHIEAFLFLVGGNDSQAHDYLVEIMSRTELEPRLEVNTPLLFVNES